MRQNWPSSPSLYFIKDKYLLALLVLETLIVLSLVEFFDRMQTACGKVRVAKSVLLFPQALVYVSTAYSRRPHCEIREQVYPVPIDYQQIFDGKMLDKETSK